MKRQLLNMSAKRNTNNSTTSDLNEQISQINTCLQEIKKDNEINASSNKKIHEDLLHMKDEIISNLVEANKELQLKVNILEGKIYEQRKYNKKQQLFLSLR